MTTDVLALGLFNASAASAGRLRGLSAAVALPLSKQRRCGLWICLDAINSLTAELGRFRDLGRALARFRHVHDRQYVVTGIARLPTR